MASASTPFTSTNNPALLLHQRARRALALCASASIVLHVILLAALPGFEAMTIVPEASMLDVVLVEPSPAPVIVAEPATKPDMSPPKSDGVPQPRIAKPPSRPDRRAAPQRKRETHRTTEFDTPSTQAPSAPVQQSPANSVPSTPVAPRVPESSGVAGGGKPPAFKRDAAPVTPPAFTASYLSNPAPRYPLIARRNGEQGTVTLRVLVTRDGAPARVAIEQTSGSRHLDSAALETVKTWRFVPARKGEEAIEAWVIVPIVFRLEGTS